MLKFLKAETLMYFILLSLSSACALKLEQWICVVRALRVEGACSLDLWMFQIQGCKKMIDTVPTAKAKTSILNPRPEMLEKQIPGS